MPKLIRITTVPISLKFLITGQMRFMREHGWEVLMVSADGPERKAVIEAEDCRHEIIPMTRTVNPRSDIRCLRQLIRLFRSEKPDIVHSHTPKAGLLGMLAAKLTGVPVRIHTVAGMPLMTATGTAKFILNVTERLTYAAATHVWPNSRSLLKYIRVKRLVSNRKLDIVGGGSSNGIDLNVYTREAVSSEKLSEVQESIHYDSDLTYLLAIGRMVVDKGIPELISVFDQLFQEHPHLRLILLGPLEQERSAETLPTHIVRKIQEHPGIIHFQWSDEIPAFLHLADIFIHCSHREGFPNVVLQAGAMECPIVCSNIPGNIDIVEHEKTGLQFQVKDEAALSASLNRALSNREWVQLMATDLRAVVQRQFARKQIHDELLTRYNYLINE